MRSHSIDRGCVCAFCFAFFLAFLLAGCGGDDSDGDGGGDGGAAADADTDADTDTDADGDGDACETCAEALCIRNITGKVVYDNGDPAQGNVQVCLTVCLTVPLGDDGAFDAVLDSSDACVMGFPAGQRIDLTLLDPDPQNPGTHARYSCAFTPTQAEVSDQGAEDFTLDLGTHTLHAIPSGLDAPYDPAGGAAVDIDGLALDVPAGSLGDEALTIRVFKLPDSAERPCFDAVAADALYFLSPYGLTPEVGDPVTLSVEAPDGCAEGDAVEFLFLGDFVDGAFLYCDAEMVPIGDFVACGSGTVDAFGRVEMDKPVQRFTWVGVRRVP